MSRVTQVDVELHKLYSEYSANQKIINVSTLVHFEQVLEKLLMFTIVTRVHRYLSSYLVP